MKTQTIVETRRVGGGQTPATRGFQQIKPLHSQKFS